MTNRRDMLLAVIAAILAMAFAVAVIATAITAEANDASVATSTD